MKNLCGKTVTRENAYEVWSNTDWTWYVLKKKPFTEERLFSDTSLTNALLKLL
jgi:hypothetical protein